MSSEPAYQTIRLRRAGWVAHLSFARAARRNALTHEMMREIGDAVGRVGRDTTLRALVLRGEGGFYCAGGDLEAMAQMPPPVKDGPDPLIAPYRYFGDVLAELNRLPQAVISIVEGPAVGGGLGMVCCSDVVIMHASARFGIPEPRVGFIPSQIIPFLVRRAGEGMVRQLAVSGVTIDAQAARACGIGSIVVADQNGIDKALSEVLANIQRMEPQALAAVKRLVLNCATDEDTKVMDDASRDLVGLLRRPAAREGIAAFMEKRLPSWADLEPALADKIKVAGE